MPDRLLDTKEACAYLHISRRLMQDLLSGGSLPAIRIGRCWRFRRESLERWIEDRERTSTVVAP